MKTTENRTMSTVHDAIFVGDCDCVVMFLHSYDEYLGQGGCALEGALSVVEACVVACGSRIPVLIWIFPIFVSKHGEYLGQGGALRSVRCRLWRPDTSGDLEFRSCL